jgi:hypothetical protein
MELMAHNNFHTCYQAVFHHHGAMGFDWSMQPFRTYSDYSRVSISKSTKNFLPFWAFPVADKVDKSAEI